MSYNFFFINEPVVTLIGLVTLFHLGREPFRPSVIVVLLFRLILNCLISHVPSELSHHCLQPWCWVNHQRRIICKQQLTRESLWLIPGISYWLLSPASFRRSLLSLRPCSCWTNTGPTLLPQPVVLSDVHTKRCKELSNWKMMDRSQGTDNTGLHF